MIAMKVMLAAMLLHCDGFVLHWRCEHAKHLMIMESQEELLAALRRRGKKPSISVRFAPSPPAPGLEFMHGLMVLTASEKLREAGTAMVVCSDIDTLRCVADEQEAAATPLRQMLLAYDGDDLAAACSAGASVVLVHDESKAARAREAGLVPVAVAVEVSEASKLAQRIETPVGVASVVDSRKLQTSEVCLLYETSELAESALEELAMSTAEKGLDGLFLSPLAQQNLADVSDTLASRVQHLRSGKSKVFAGYLANAGMSTQLEYTDEQRKAIAWGKFVQNAERAGLVEDGNQPPVETSGDIDAEGDLGDFDDPMTSSFDREGSAPRRDSGAVSGLNTERGDYLGF